MTDGTLGIAATVQARSSSPLRNLLLCFSHLRWDFVFQRPQHLLSRAVRDFDVLFFEEPLFRPGITPQLEVRSTPEGVTVAVPLLPDGMHSVASIAAQRA